MKIFKLILIILKRILLGGFVKDEFMELFALIKESFKNYNGLKI